MADKKPRQIAGRRRHGGDLEKVLVPVAGGAVAGVSAVLVAERAGLSRRAAAATVTAVGAGVALTTSGTTQKMGMGAAAGGATLLAVDFMTSPPKQQTSAGAARNDGRSNQLMDRAEREMNRPSIQTSAGAYAN